MKKDPPEISGKVPPGNPRELLKGIHYMSINGIKKGDGAGKAFDSFDVDELEILEVVQGVALPEIGAASGSIGTSSSSSSTCSAC
jgi:thiazolylpeptide-type bacteriocin precursor